MQLLRKRPQIFRLGSPVDARCHDVFPLENHPRILIKHFPNIFFIVLAAEANHHSGIALRNRELLQRSTGRVHLDATRAVLSADSTPKGVVAIENHDFVGRRMNRIEAADNHGPQGREELLCVGDMSYFIGERIFVI